MDRGLEHKLHEVDQVQIAFEIEMIGFLVEQAVNINRGEIAAGIVQESVFATGIGGVETVVMCAYLTVFTGRAGVPGVEGVCKLRGRVGTAPG